MGLPATREAHCFARTIESPIIRRSRRNVGRLSNVNSAPVVGMRSRLRRQPLAKKVIA